MELTHLSSKKTWSLGVASLVATIVWGGALSGSSDRGRTAPFERDHERGRFAPHPEGASFLKDASLRAETDLKRRVSQAYGQLPLTFESNRGQTDSRVDFVARGQGYTLFLTSTEAVFSLSRHRKAGTDPLVDTSRSLRPHQPPSTLESSVLRMQLIGSNPHPRVEGRDELPGKVHYFLGNDATKWRTNVPTFARVHYTDIYPGIDLSFYGNQRQLEYDFIVGPGADPRRITLRFQGADAVEVDATGDLVLRAPGGAIRQHAPRIYQDIDGRRQAISGGYVLRGRSMVGFEVGGCATL